MSDVFPVRVVVVALALVVVGGLGSIVFLAATQTPIPDALDRLIFSALGATGALLAKTSGTATATDSSHTPAHLAPAEEST